MTKIKAYIFNLFEFELKFIKPNSRHIRPTNEFNSSTFLIASKRESTIA